MPHDHTNLQPAVLDDVDWALLRLLTRDARQAGATLARALGIAESTCSARIRRLVRLGVIEQFSIRTNPSRLGRGVQAMIAVRLGGHDRQLVDSFGRDTAALAEVTAVYNVSGGNDFLVHVGCASGAALRDFVLDHISSRRGVTHVETSLIFSTYHAQHDASSDRPDTRSHRAGSSPAARRLG